MNYIFNDNQLNEIKNFLEDPYYQIPSLAKCLALDENDILETCKIININTENRMNKKLKKEIQ